MSDAIRLSGLAGAVTLAAGSMAYANIVVVGGPADLSATGSIGFDTNNVLWDVDGDGTNDLEFNFRGTPLSPTYAWQANVFTLGGSSVSGYAGLFVSFYGSQVSMGDSVASSGLVPGIDGSNIALGSDYSGLAYGGWGATGGSTSTGFLGFRLANGNFGWVELTAGSTGIQFLGAAYDNSGADIAAGAVPTPGSLGALAIGAAAMLRRKRAA
jgi:hypothetical protein